MDKTQNEPCQGSNTHVTQTHLLSQNLALLIESRFSHRSQAVKAETKAREFPTSPTQKPKNTRNDLNMDARRLDKDKPEGRPVSTQHNRRGNETQVQHIRVELLQSAHLRT